MGSSAGFGSARVGIGVDAEASAGDLEAVQKEVADLDYVCLVLEWNLGSIKRGIGMEPHVETRGTEADRIAAAERCGRVGHF
jgi:hypothetical protein